MVRGALLAVAVACAVLGSVYGMELDRVAVPQAALRARFERRSLYSTFVGTHVVTFAGMANNFTLGAAEYNGELMNQTLAALQPGDVLVLPNTTFFMMGGIVGHNLRDVTISFEGTIVYSNDMKAWPRTTPGKNGQVLECFQLYNSSNVRLVGTPDGLSLIDGQGSAWWGLPGIGYLLIGENRPRLLTMSNSQDILVENLYLKNSPYWTSWFPSCNRCEIRNMRVEATRYNSTSTKHNILDITAFNTDGIDVTGNEIYIHSSFIDNQDDCVALKDGSTSVLVENIVASGLGMTIGSIGGSTNRNLTFRNIMMPNTYKGIYTKFRSAGIVEDVLYENITMLAVEQYAIWIGPAQQSDSDNLCAAHPCSLCWPLLAPWAKCNAPEGGYYRNVTLRDITVNGAKNSPGVILANTTTPMINVTFENVVVTNAGDKPFGSNYKCEGVQSGVAIGTTSPVPSCFTDLTDHRASQ